MLQDQWILSKNAQLIRFVMRINVQSDKHTICQIGCATINNIIELDQVGIEVYSPVY